MPRNRIIGIEQMELAGFHPLTVRSVVPETADAASLVFDTPADGTFDYRAGQYLTLRLQIAGKPVLRCYSMSSAPLAGEPLAITVKRVAGGVASNWLIDHVRPGERILARPPSGTFVLGKNSGPCCSLPEAAASPRSSPSCARHWPATDPRSASSMPASHPRRKFSGLPSTGSRRPMPDG